MGFRKNAYAKVFVDDHIPSFLTEKKPQAHYPIREPQAEPDDSQPESESGADILPISRPKQHSRRANGVLELQSLPFEDRRRRPLEIRPRFLIKAIGLAIVLNAALYTVFRYGPPQADAMVSPAPPSAETAGPADMTRGREIVSFSFPK